MTSDETHLRIRHLEMQITTLRAELERATVEHLILLAAATPRLERAK